MSNFYCHPGRAGGTLNLLVYATSKSPSRLRSQRNTHIVGRMAHDLSAPPRDAAPTNGAYSRPSCGRAVHSLPAASPVSGPQEARPQYWTACRCPCRCPAPTNGGCPRPPARTYALSGRMAGPADYAPPLRSLARSASGNRLDTQHPIGGGLMALRQEGTSQLGRIYNRDWT